MGGPILDLDSSSAGVSGADHCQSRPRALRWLERMRRVASSQLSVSNKARTENNDSAFSSSQYIEFPFSRRLIDRRIVLSIAPLPIGNPEIRNLPVDRRPAAPCFCEYASSVQNFRQVRPESSQANPGSWALCSGNCLRHSR